MILGARLAERNNRRRWIIGPHFRDATGWAFADWKGEEAIMPLRPSDNEKHADPLNWMVMDRHGWKVRRPEPRGSTQCGLWPMLWPNLPA